MSSAPLPISTVATRPTSEATYLMKSRPRRDATGLFAPGRGSLHSITSSARARIDWGMVSPRAFAVLRLITSSDFGRLLDREIAGPRTLQYLPR